MNIKLLLESKTSARILSFYNAIYKEFLTANKKEQKEILKDILTSKSLDYFWYSPIFRFFLRKSKLSRFEKLLLRLRCNHFSKLKYEQYIQDCKELGLYGNTLYDRL